MTFKRICRVYFAICSLCWGSGLQNTNHGPVKCTNPDCVSGEIAKWIIELVHDDSITEAA